MAARKGKAGGVNNAEPISSPEHKIAGLLALIATKDMETEQAALKLSAIGFTANEIAALLGVGTNYVHAAKHKVKSAGKKKRKRD